MYPVFTSTLINLPPNLNINDRLQLVEHVHVCVFEKINPNDMLIRCVSSWIAQSPTSFIVVSWL